MLPAAPSGEVRRLSVYCAPHARGRAAPAKSCAGAKMRIIEAGAENLYFYMPMQLAEENEARNGVTDSAMSTRDQGSKVSLLVCVRAVSRAVRWDVIHFADAAFLGKIDRERWNERGKRRGRRSARRAQSFAPPLGRPSWSLKLASARRLVSPACAMGTGTARKSRSGISLRSSMGT